MQFGDFYAIVIAIVAYGIRGAALTQEAIGSCTMWGICGTGGILNDPIPCYVQNKAAELVTLIPLYILYL